MHLLATKPGNISDGGQAIDLGQTPGEIVVLAAADSELACLAGAFAGLDGQPPSLRLANLLRLSHHLSVDRYVETIVAQARLVVVRLLGGYRYWPHGIEQISAVCRERGIALACLPGDDQPDPELDEYSTLPASARHRLWRYLVEGGQENARNFLAYAWSLLGGQGEWREPRPLLRAGLYWPGLDLASLEDLKSRWTTNAQVAGIVFYRALLQAGQTAPIDALMTAIEARGLNPLPIYVAGLKEKLAQELIDDLYRACLPAVTLNCTGFAVSRPGSGGPVAPFDASDAPVLQVVMSSGTQEDWRAGQQGLSPRDLAMQVALPELDGRILSRAISFKARSRYDAATQCELVAPVAIADRVDFVADLAAAWARLRATRPGERRVGIILANYPNRDGRIGNGVGLDTPAGTIEVLKALKSAGYAIGEAPRDGAALLEMLLSGPTNAPDRIGPARGEALSLGDYEEFLATLAPAVLDRMVERWGGPQADPFFKDGAFRLKLHRFGNILIGIQPARGYNIDPAKSYHDPDLPPPHGYLAFYAYLRRVADIHAIIHMGKHGNLEWLPGKALALDRASFPEAALGPLAHLYPFIVNDPGEGAQAKRRAQAVIVDHLTPPLARAESYGPLRELELLVDEYYEAAQLDPRRCLELRRRILDIARSGGMAEDCGILPEDDPEKALAKLDNQLCELKEMQIRDGLHVFGRAPEGRLLDALLVALTRLPRESGEGARQSIIRALAEDLGLSSGFDPLDARLADPWNDARPTILAGLSGDAWRSAGDAVERLELLALKLIAGEIALDPSWTRTRRVLDFIETDLRPRLEASGPAELAGILKGLAGGFVPPGPSGAPSRGRLDVLPTGRNFYSVDTRAVPTPSAWNLGWKSAALLLERHLQEHGSWPKALVLSAWGTANMRTGGDDIAQALALMGVRPRWDQGGSGRVSGFEIMPLGVLDRPRVDMTLRVSGFFRDAFPAQIDLFDSAVRALARLDEPEHLNPIAQRWREESARMMEEGAPREVAERRAGFRVFGSKPGAYGAGLQALIDEKGWRDEGDFARAYLAWGGFAYGGGADGEPAPASLARRLSRIDAILHNQDNREHDLLDSDDYYQFEGGLAASVKHLTGRKAVVWHNDHSRPEAPKVRSLDEEIARVLRARVVNPKWIAGVMRHGYKGAFEMAATVDYLFAFAATADCVADHHFDLVFDAYLGAAEVREFLARVNPAALREMAGRLIEAQDRGLWKPRSNNTHLTLRELASVP